MSLKHQNCLIQMTLPSQNRLLIVRFYEPAVAIRAYRWLQYHQISPEHLALLGSRLNTLQLRQVLHPWQFLQAYKSPLSQQMSILGAALGIALCFSYITEFNATSTPDLGRWLQWLQLILAGLLGGMTGALIGQSIIWVWALLQFRYYQRLLRRGNILLLIEGPASLVAEASHLLEQLKHQPSTSSSQDEWPDA
jgi:hypothetical protein